MRKEQLIETIVDLVQRQECVYFVGSGISVDSGLPTWSQLLQPICEKVEMTLDRDDNLPMIAQYIINKCNGNRMILVNHMRDKLSGGSVNGNHIAIANTVLPTIWTTNYDCLLETAFSGRSFDVRVEDFNLLYSRAHSKTEIMKLHGCIKTSAPDKLVITQSDYDDMEVNRPAMISRLTTDLMNKSFLFVGYGMNDPDIRAALVIARRLGGERCTRTHYMILRKPKKFKDESEEEFSRRKTMTELWIDDLRRYGILTLYIDDHGELTDILERISILSKGKTVYVTGSHEFLSKSPSELGGRLAEIEGLKLLYGQSEGIGKEVMTGFISKCVADTSELGDRIEIFPNPYVGRIEPTYDEKDPFLRRLVIERRRVFERTRLMLVFPGFIGTKVEINLALEYMFPVIPVITDADDYGNAAIKLILDDKNLMDRLKKNIYIEKINKKEVPSMDELLTYIRWILDENNQP